MEEKRTYNLFQKFVGSTSSPRFFADMVGSKTSAAIGYICLLTVILSLVTSTIFGLGFREAMDFINTGFADNAPEFEISGGEFRMSGPQYFEMIEGDAAIIIDLEDRMSPSQMEQYTTGVYINKDFMYSIQYGQFQQPQPWSSFQGTVITKADTIQFLNILRDVWVVFIFLGVLFAVLGKLFSSLIVSVIAMVVSAITSAKLTYRDGYILGVYAMTGPTLLKFAQSMLAIAFPGLTIPGFGLVYYLIIGFVLYVGMREYTKQKEASPDVDQDPLA